MERPARGLARRREVDRAGQIETGVALAAARAARRRTASCRARAAADMRRAVVAIEIAIERRICREHRPLERRDGAHDVGERDRMRICRKAPANRCGVGRRAAKRATISSSRPFRPSSIGCSLNIGTAICASSVRSARIGPAERRVVRDVRERHRAARVRLRRSIPARARGRR